MKLEVRHDDFHKIISRQAQLEQILLSKAMAQSTSLILLLVAVLFTVCMI